MSGKRMSGTEAIQFRILRKRAYHGQNGKCFWCGVAMCLVAGCPCQCTGDHVDPLCLGGRTVPGNVVAACARCNNERHPEFNSVGVGVVATTGETISHSPFSVLQSG